MFELKKYREELDCIDEKIISLLADRFLLVKKIGDYKKQYNLKILQENRWQEVILTRKDIANKYGVNDKLIESIWNEIHKESLKLQK